MGTTPKLGLRYPELSSAPNVPQDLLNLATDVDSALGALGEGWETFTPTVYTSMGTTPTPIAAGSITVEYALKLHVGKTMRAIASVIINVASTTGGVGIDLPAPAVQRLYNVGTMALMGTGTLPSDQSGIAYMAAGPPFDKLVLVAWSQGFRDVGGTGQRLRYSVCYPTA